MSVADVRKVARVEGQENVNADLPVRQRPRTRLATAQSSDSGDSKNSVRIYRWRSGDIDRAGCRGQSGIPRLPPQSSSLDFIRLEFGSRIPGPGRRASLADDEPAAILQIDKVSTVIGANDAPDTADDLLPRRIQNERGDVLTALAGANFVQPTMELVVITSESEIE
jgi:hypothetical protein